MIRAVFVCNTYMQLINATNIVLNGLPELEADLILTDHSVNAGLVACEVSKTNVYRKVEYIETKYYLFQQDFFHNLQDVWDLGFRNNNRYLGLFHQLELDYDFIISFNIDVLIYALYDELEKHGQNPECVFMEEGIHGYSGILNSKVGKRIKAINFLRFFSQKRNVYRKYRKAYCYYPEFIGDNSKIKGLLIPSLSRNDRKLINLLNNFFIYNPDQKIFSQRYIYFATSTDIDGTPVGETELVLKISEMVGRENLLIKMHPRDDRTVYTDYGLTVSRTSTVPWEVIQLNHNFSNHIFLSLSSGSIINATAILDDNIEGYFLFPMVKGRNQIVDVMGNHIEELLRQLQFMGKCMKFHVIENMLDLESALMKTDNLE